MEQVREFIKRKPLECALNRNYSISDLTGMTLSLTESVKQYHGKDEPVLLLDISPKTIEVSGYTLRAIPLAQYSKEHIHSQQIQLPALSGPWVAPEVRHKESKRVCEASDIYSIGAVLFWLIYKRAPAPADIVFNYKLDLPCNLKRRPLYQKADGCLRFILCKTLNNSVKSRFQSISELQSELLYLKEMASAV